MDESEAKYERMTKKPVAGLICRLAWPMIISMLDCHKQYDAAVDWKNLSGQHTCHVQAGDIPDPNSYDIARNYGTRMGTVGTDRGRYSDIFVICTGYRCDTEEIAVD